MTQSVSFQPHIPVMLSEVLAQMQPHDGGLYVDGTFGAGGYSRAFMDSAQCRVIGIDRDPETHRRAAGWRAQYGDRLQVVHDTFGNVKNIVNGRVDGFVLDLGVSSMQLDQADRGFSFRHDGPLDMRMDQTSGQSAADIVNTMDETPLADLIYLYGEERHSRRIARTIVSRRSERPFERTADFAQAVRSAMPRAKAGDIDPATRTFQALRIAVNDELGELERALDASVDILAEGGRLVVVTFHSLEDRIVKNFIREKSGDRPSPSRHVPAAEDHSDQAVFRVLSRKAIDPSDEEIHRNPRARSAKLRMAIRTEACMQEMVTP